jgi:hypothetical protein
MYPHEMSLEKTKIAAESGDPKAAFHLGWCYYIGKGLARDKAEARKWYSKAASQGVREAAEIRGILEVEAQRDLELEVLRTAVVSPRKGPTAWLLLVCAILISIGSVAALFHVFDGLSNGRRPGAAEDGRATEAGAVLHVANQLPTNPEKETTLAREEVMSGDSTTASVAGHSSGGVMPEHGNTDSAVAVEPRTQPRQPTDPKRSVGPRADFKDWVERASRWLKDGNDPYSPSRPSEATDQKRGREED